MPRRRSRTGGVAAGAIADGRSASSWRLRSVLPVRSTAREVGDLSPPSGCGAAQQVVVQGFGGCTPTECLAWATVECAREGADLAGAVPAEISAPWEVLAQEAVDVFVAAALPGAVWIAEVDLDAGVDPQPGVLGHLRALIP